MTITFSVQTNTEQGLFQVEVFEGEQRIANRIAHTVEELAQIARDFQPLELLKAQKRVTELEAEVSQLRSNNKALEWNNLSENEQGMLVKIGAYESGMVLTWRRRQATEDALSTLRSKNLVSVEIREQRTWYALTPAGRALIPADSEDAAQADTLKARVAELEAHLKFIRGMCLTGLANVSVYSATLDMQAILKSTEEALEAAKEGEGE